MPSMILSRAKEMSYVYSSVWPSVIQMWYRPSLFLSVFLVLELYLVFCFVLFLFFIFFFESGLVSVASTGLVLKVYATALDSFLPFKWIKYT